MGQYIANHDTLCCTITGAVYNEQVNNQVVWETTGRRLQFKENPVQKVK